MSKTVQSDAERPSIKLRPPLGWSRAVLGGVLAAVISWGVVVLFALAAYLPLADNAWLVGTTWASAVRVASNIWALSLLTELTFSGVTISLPPLGITALTVWLIAVFLSRMTRAHKVALGIGALTFAMVAAMLVGGTAAITSAGATFPGALLIGAIGAIFAAIRINRRNRKYLKNAAKYRTACANTQNYEEQLPPSGSKLRDFWNALRYHPPAPFEEAGPKETVPVFTEALSLQELEVLAESEAEDEVFRGEITFSLMGRVFTWPAWVRDIGITVRAVATCAVTVCAVLLLVGLFYARASVISSTATLDATQNSAFQMFFAQAAYVPTVLIWILEWMLGPGFSIGTQASFSAFAVTPGPLPAIPILLAIPGKAVGSVPLLCALAMAFLLGIYLTWRTRERTTLERFYSLGGASIIILGALAALIIAATGAIGPGRLAQSGGTVWPTIAIFAAIFIAPVGGCYLLTAKIAVNFYRRIFGFAKVNSLALATGTKAAATQKLGEKLAGTGLAGRKKSAQKPAGGVAGQEDPLDEETCSAQQPINEQGKSDIKNEN